MKAILAAASAAIIASASAMANNLDPNNPSGNVVDRFADIEVLRYTVPGFNELSPRQRLLVYYLTEAALQGRDILWDQNGRYNLQLRRVLESLYQNYKGDRATPEFLAFEKYLKQVEFGNGPHHHYSADKFVPGFTRGWFDGALAEAGIPAPSAEV
nr:dihydrofolate reductase [Muribaculaceae bacterium]